MLLKAEEMAFEIAEKIVKLSDKYKIPYIFKGSFKNQQKQSEQFHRNWRRKSLEIIKKKVGEHFNIPTTTDIHENAHAELRLLME